jgi:hypothetical protein
MRKSWKKPKLIVLVRGTTDERVLQACVVAEESPVLQADELETCWVNASFCGPCKD